MTEEHLISLIARKLYGRLDPAEVEELEQWAAENEANRLLLTQASDEQWLSKEIDRYREIDPASGYNRWLTSMDHRRTRKIKIAGWAIAASLAGAFIIAGILYQGGNNKPAPAIAEKAHAIMPGRNTAILTLSGGRQVLLDSVAAGVVTSQGDVRVEKADSTRLDYQKATRSGSGAIAYNVLETPRSGQYQLTLADGSRVWLNNVSRLLYPTSLEGARRIVELDGEAYFEIAKDAAKPFIVKVRDQEVEVLGTSFNVMAYPDEGGSQTTLLTGSVRVKSGPESMQLNPNEQAVIRPAGSIQLVQNVDARDIISWKDGFFYFGHASFEAVMRQLARWYNIDVVYEGAVPNMEFGGKVDRSLLLDDLLSYLDKNHVHFKLEGRKLIVLSR